MMIRKDTPRFYRDEEEEDDNNSKISNPNLIRHESGVVALRYPSENRRSDVLEKVRQMHALEYAARSAVADFSAAITASFFVAIPVMIIDKAIVQSVAGTVPLEVGLSRGLQNLAKYPLKILMERSFFMVFGVYSATYITANSFESQIQRPISQENQDWNSPFSDDDDIDAIDEEQEIVDNNDARVNALNGAKFIGVTAVNMACAVCKDRAFARMFGTIAPSKLPAVSWALWVTRDLLTIGAAFSIPRPLSQYLSRERDNGQSPFLSKYYAGLVSQLLPVILVQVVSTPLHLAANDFYNFKSNEPRVADPLTGVVQSGRKTPQERMALLFREGPKVFIARIGRIAPAFGIGGIYNTKIRDNVRKRMGLA